ncbi:hypothetical protein [Pediococcus parvulus]|uniref:hypothetical protein n=1 Tax=Pediococcus parvulus TaxID=54062 RepID=UPI00345E4DF2
MSEDKLIQNDDLENEQDEEPASNHQKLEPEYGKYMYWEIIRDFPIMADYIGHYIQGNRFTAVNLIDLASSLGLRLDYSSELRTDFKLYRTKKSDIDVLIVSARHASIQDKAWYAAKGMANYILGDAEYVPDFSQNQGALNKWTDEKIAAKLLLPNDLLERDIDFATTYNRDLLNEVGERNAGVLFPYARLNIIGHTAAQIANVPDWLMEQRVDEFYNG